MVVLKRSLAVVTTFVILFATLTCFKSHYIDRDTESVKQTKESKSEGPNGDKDNGGSEDELFCAVLNPLSGAYIDLSQLSSTPNRPQDGEKNSGTNGRNNKDSPTSRWLIRGWNYNTNFTLGICSSPVTEVEENQVSNSTGAFYKDPQNEKTLVSIGNFATKPTLMGNKKVTMKYENGSMCPNGIDRKSTLLYFVCDKEISTKAQITYIGNLHECSYFFEVRSVYACPTSNKSKEVNVLGIFVGIFAVFFLVEYGGRRWLYGKMKAHFNSSPLSSSSSSSPQSLSYNNPYTSNESGFRPRWEYIEREPRWKSLIKSLGNLFTTGLLRPRNFPKPSMTASGPIRLSSQSSRSQESFLQDMEQQNNILDSLEVATNDTRSTTDSTTRRID